MTDSQPSQPQSLVLNLVAAPAANQPPAPAEWDPVEMTRVNRDDIAAIVGSKFELQIKAKIVECVRAEKEIVAQLTAAQKNAAALFDAFVSSSEASPVIRKIKSCFDDLSYTTDLTTSACYVGRLPTDDWTYKSDAGSSSSDPNAAIRLSCSLSIVTPTGDTHRFQMHRNAGLPAELRETLNNIASLTTQLKTAQDAVLDARRELTNIASVERLAKAAMAKTALNSSERGRAILASLDSINGAGPTLPETNPKYLPNG